MAIQTKDQAQDKVNKKLDRVLFKKTKQRPLSEESWSDLNQRGATLAEQMKWIELKRKQNDREM